MALINCCHIAYHSRIVGLIQGGHCSCGRCRLTTLRSRNCCRQYVMSVMGCIYGHLMMVVMIRLLVLLVLVLLLVVLVLLLSLF